MTKKQKIILISFAAVIILFLLWFIFDGVAVEAYKIKSQDAIKGVTVTGMVKSTEDTLVTTNIIGIIEKFYVKEGDYVKKGQLIATLLREEAEGYLESAEGKLYTARWDLENLLTEPRQQEVEIAKSNIIHKQQQLSVLQYTYKRIQADLEYAKLEEKRYKVLEEAGAVTKRESEQKILARRELENSLGETLESGHQIMAEIFQAKENLSLTIQKIKKEQINSAKGQVYSAQGDVKASEGNLYKYIIRAPVSGIVVDRILHTGDAVSPTSPIVRLVVPEKRYLSMDAEENETEFIKSGQEAFAVFDAYPDKIFKCSVFQTAKMVNPSTGTFETKLTIPKERVKIVVGMTVDATIITNKLKNTIIIPADYLIQKKEEAAYVFKKVGFWAVKTPVKVENFDNNRIKIICGLKTGDIILKSLENNKLKNNKHIKITGYFEQ